MPRLSVFMVRAALLHFGFGLMIASLALFNKGIPFDSILWRFVPIHVEVLIFGWMMQFALGVAFWIMPRFATGSRYGRVWLARAAFMLLNTGVVAAAVGLSWNIPLLVFIGRGTLLLAVIAFAVHIVPRVKPFAESPPVQKSASR